MSAQRRPKKPQAAIAVLLTLMLGIFVAACGGDDDGSDGNGNTQAGGAETEAAQQLVDDHMGPLEWEDPGPAFDASQAEGNDVLIVNVTSAVPAVKELSEFTTEALSEVGVNAEEADGKASPTEFARLMRQGIGQGVDAILLNAVDPKAVTQPLRAAEEAGIPVIAMFEADPAQPLPDGIVGRSDFSYERAGRLLAAWAAADSNGSANAVAIQSSDAPSQAAMLGGFEDAWDQYCPECPLEVEDVAVPDWQSRLGPVVESALNQNPDLNYVLPMYDGMMLQVVPAVRQAGALDRVKMGSLNATPAVMEMLEAGEIEMNIGESNPWLAWGAADQLLRAMVGQDTVDDENIPLRVFTQENFPSDVGDPSDPSTWYGDVDFRANYRELWGIE